MQAILAIFLIVSCGNLAFVSAQECQVCQENNDVYCHNQTSYQNCMRGKPFGDVEQCALGTVCTNDLNVCLKNPDGTTTKDVCGTASGCESCVQGQKYTCVSRSQFARCKGTTALTSTIYDCGEGELCSQGNFTEFGTVCVPSCVLDFLEINPTCTNTEFTTTTTTAAPPTTPSTEDEQNICDAAAYGTTAAPGATDPTGTTTSSTAATAATSTTAKPAAKYFYTRVTGDSTCSSYLYCQKSANDTEWTTVLLRCQTASKPYYDSATQTCVATKPTDCS